MDPQATGTTTPCKPKQDVEKDVRDMHVLVLPALTYVSFHTQGWLTFLPMIEAFVLIPSIRLQQCVDFT